MKSASGVKKYSIQKQLLIMGVLRRITAFVTSPDTLPQVEDSLARTNTCTLQLSHMGIMASELDASICVEIMHETGMYVDVFSSPGNIRLLIPGNGSWSKMLDRHLRNRPKM